MTSTRATPWSIDYADGSANRYHFTQADPAARVAFSYDPVRPEESSTGHYSGGDPRQEQIAPGDARVAELWRRVEALEADRALHVELRGKGTGAFAVRTPAGERSFIIVRGEALGAFDAFLAGFGAR